MHLAVRIAIGCLVFMVPFLAFPRGRPTLQHKIQAATATVRFSTDHRDLAIVTRMRRLLFALAVFSPILPAQKKPVTIDDVLNRFKPNAPRPVDPVWSPDDQRFVYIEGGKLILFDIASKAKRELIAMKQLNDSAAPVPEPEVFDWTNRRVSESPIQWFSSGDRLLVEEDGDLFLVSLTPAAPLKAPVEQLTKTDVPEADPKLSPDGKSVSFRRAHDLYCMDIATKKVTRLTSNGSDTLLNAQLDWVYPEELDLGTAHWWSPDSRHIAFLQLDTHSEPLFPQVSLLKSRGLLEPERYPKAGEPNAEARVAIVDVDSGRTRFLDLGETRDALIARVTWLPDSSAVAVMRLNRIQNNLDLIRAGLDGSTDTLIHETDPYWINVVDEPYFLKNGKEFLWESERGEGGFRHLYLYGMDGKLKRQITKGNWVVERCMAVDEASGRIFYMSTEESPTGSRLYAVDLNGKHRTLLSPAPGVHAVSISPHGAYFTDAFSNLDSPPSQAIRRADGSELMTWMQADMTIANTYMLSKPEIVEVKSTNGDTMYGKLFKPVPFDPAKKYPVIVQVYGGPGAQSVRNIWSGLTDDQFFAAKGFIIWVMDNHGSTGRGHAWESVIFRNMGQHELEDQRLGVDWLKKQSYVDGARIAITGWSYGGYMTLYSLVNAPDVFKCGLAGAPVTDWRNYDTIYTERYMGLPQVNGDAYDHSSPKTHAGNLKAPLLIVHNIEDDNVHFQNSVQMADALERAAKQFRMVVYPQKFHGVFGPYARSLAETRLSFFEENLK